MQMIQTVLLTVLVFFVIVTIHEWGHYYFAKRAGILVREFAIGFGPKLFSFKRGETKFTLRLVPAGGYVRMAGEDPEIVEVQTGQTIAVRLKDGVVHRIYLDRLDERSEAIRGEVLSVDLERQLHIDLDIDGEVEKYSIHPQALVIARGNETQIAPIDRHFSSKTVGKRAMAIFAGPMMNFILAFVLFLVYVQMAGIKDSILVGDIPIQESPAAKANLHVGDKIISVNGEVIGADFSKMIDIIAVNSNKPLDIQIERDGVAQNIQVTPLPDEAGDGKIGVIPSYGTRSAGFSETFTEAGTIMKDMTVMIFDGLKMLVTLQFDLDDLGGPVRTAEFTAEVAQQGIVQLTSWTAVLSLYLGIFNLLPVPALDGSRLLFIGLEAIRRKPINPNKEAFVHFIGFAMLMLLMLVVTYNDILRLIRGE
ncbi:MAG: RIP metalloprotease RseP [Candidatus Pristimantibacillus lignocellulolyticus]|uniref:Zinc metalloprotease n=1 Tax=Candidatus Pristimantibacillus lignocellulolyticus TaxID=2994561 RepID=A0A9J6ZBQ0_9BACL|nr:MAG: RIP metalloprotease RseP [Candidatus Pristimantibacillus lignocellulolyticus]